LSNTFIYTKEGSVEWKISTEKEGDSLWLISTISDTGPGIAPKNIGTIFDDYKNLSVRKDVGKSGAGMGLPIAKKMAELMGGTITLESIYGRGSVFTVKIRQKYINDMVISPETAESLKKLKYP
jgi:signal transduction histidine kinase